MILTIFFIPFKPLQCLISGLLLMLLFRTILRLIQDIEFVLLLCCCQNELLNFHTFVSFLGTPTAKTSQSNPTVPQKKSYMKVKISSFV